MNDIQLHINKYLDYCSQQKRLDKKTIKAYRIDLDQFVNYISETQLTDLTQDALELYISYLHQNYHPKTVKRKIASLKAMFHYFEYKGLIVQTPFSKMQIKFREPIILPKTIPLHTVEYLLKVIYRQQTNAKTAYQRKNAIRDTAVCSFLTAALFFLCFLICHHFLLSYVPDYVLSLCRNIGKCPVSKGKVQFQFHHFHKTHTVIGIKKGLLLYGNNPSFYPILFYYTAITQNSL